MRLWSTRLELLVNRFECADVNDHVRARRPARRYDDNDIRKYMSRDDDHLNSSHRVFFQLNILKIVLERELS